MWLPAEHSLVFPRILVVVQTKAIHISLSAVAGQQVEKKHLAVTSYWPAVHELIL